MTDFLQGKSILIISPESWGRSYLSKHHYALELVKRGNRVWFLNSPFFKRNAEARQAEADNPGLHILDENDSRGLRWWPGPVIRMIMKRKAKQLERRAGVRFDVIWSFDNSRYFMRGIFGSAFVIQHVVDTHMDYQFVRSAEAAELCLGVTEQITSRLREHNARSFHLPHAFFPFQAMGGQPGNSSRKRAAYVGNLLLPGFDVDLLRRLAIRFPGVDFQLVGSYSLSHLNVQPDYERIHKISALGDLPNVILHGELDYAEAFSIATCADVLLLMYFDKVTTNSLKILPYLSTGKVILSSNVKAWENSGLLQMVSTPDEFLTRFDVILKDLAYFNSMQAMGLRSAFAKANTYSQRIEQVNEWIQLTHS